MERHPEILKPVSRAMGSPQSEIDHGALQDHRKDTLQRLGLLQSDGRSTSITSLGRLLVNQAVDESLFDGS